MHFERWVFFVVDNDPHMAGFQLFEFVEKDREKHETEPSSPRISRG